MTVDTAKGLQNLRESLNKCDTLLTVLQALTNCEQREDVIDELDCCDIIWAMSEQNDMNENDMREWVSSHLDYSAECRVFHEHGPACGWPVVSVKCMDKIFYFDWILE